jgi:hypothetical protein
VKASGLYFQGRLALMEIRKKVIWSLSKTLSNVVMGKRAVLGRMRNDSAGVILGQKILLAKFFN